MRSEKIMRFVVFAIFFCTGAAAVAVAFLANDIKKYYHDKYLIRKARETIEKIEMLNTDYSVLIEQIKKNPEMAVKVAPITLGIDANDANTVVPKARAQELNAARQILAQEIEEKSVKPTMPDWAQRCCRGEIRLVLFISGGFLIFIAFLFFGSGGDNPFIQNVSPAGPVIPEPPPSQELPPLQQTPLDEPPQ